METNARTFKLETMVNRNKYRVVYACRISQHLKAEIVSRGQIVRCEISGFLPWTTFRFYRETPFGDEAARIGGFPPKAGGTSTGSHPLLFGIFLVSPYSFTFHLLFSNHIGLAIIHSFNRRHFHSVNCSSWQSSGLKNVLLLCRLLSKVSNSTASSRAFDCASTDRCTPHWKGT